MNTPKFTPGPWGCSINHNNWGNLSKHVVYVGNNPIDEKKEICIIYSCQSYCSDAIEINKKYDEQKANAHLIAAAPDLYYELEKLIDYLEQERLIPDTDIAKAALSKARGEKQ